MIDFSLHREIQEYKADPLAMEAAAHGKCGLLDLVFELDATGKAIMSHLERHAPLIVQQELYFDECMPEMPCVYILSAGGPNVDGDRYEQRFTIKEGAFAHISTGAATKIAEMRYNHASLKQEFTLHNNSYMEYMPEATIPCRHSRYITDTNITIASSATLFYSEIYTGGRKYYGTGELFEYDLLSVCTHAHRPNGSALFREKLISTPNTLNVDNIGIMHTFHVFADIVILTPEKFIDSLIEQISPKLELNKELGLGVNRLPNRCGLILKVLGKESQPVKRVVREICSIVRNEIKHKQLPNEFIWR